MSTIATVTGKLTLTIADSPAINLGNIQIPISATTSATRAWETAQMHCMLQGGTIK